MSTEVGAVQTGKRWACQGVLLQVFVSAYVYAKHVLCMHVYHSSLSYL